MALHESYHHSSRDWAQTKVFKYRFQRNLTLSRLFILQIARSYPREEIMLSHDYTSLNSTTNSE